MLVRGLRAVLFWICRFLFKIEHAGLENIPSSGPLIIAANHQTYLDPVFIALPVRHRMRFMAWDAIFKVPLLSSLITWSGAFPVNLDKPTKAALKTSLDALKDGAALIIFPEGGRSPDGKILPFKPGTARLARASGALLLPVTVEGGEKVWPPRQFLPRCGRIRITYHKPISLERGGKRKSQGNREATCRLTQRLFDVISQNPPPPSIPSNQQ